MKKINFLLLVLVVCFGIFFVFKRDIPLEKSLLTIISQCKKVGENGFYECFRSHVTGKIEERGVNEVILSLEKVFDGSELSYRDFSCHDLSHVVGQEAVKAGGNLGITLASCTKSCEYGCAHGALIGAIKKDESLISQLSLICTPFDTQKHSPQDKDACIHGLGHAVSEFSGMDLNKSLSYCATLNGVNDKNKCAEGVFMQITDYPTTPFFKIEGTITAFCKSLDPNFESVCFETASLHEWGRSKDVEKAAYACELIPFVYKNACITNLVNLLYSNYSRSEEKILGFCGRYKNNDNYNACILGAIQSNIVEDFKASLSLNLCNQSPEEYKENCFKNVSNRYLYVYNKEFPKK